MSTERPLYRKRAGKIEVKAMPFDRYGGKLWVMATMPHEWVPSFEEIFWILKFMSHCENEKYPIEAGFRGWQMVADFCGDACKPQADFDELKQKYRLPDRAKE